MSVPSIGGLSGGSSVTSIAQQIAESIDGNKDGNVSTQEFASFLTQFLSGAQASTGTTATLPSPTVAAPGAPPGADPALWNQVKGALDNVRSSDDPTYWYGKVSADPNAWSANGPGSSWPYWLGRINTGEGVGRAGTALWTAVSGALANASSTDDPNYWYGKVSEDPNGWSGNGPGSAWSYWVGRINQGDGAAAVRAGLVQRFVDNA